MNEVLEKVKIWLEQEAEGQEVIDEYEAGLRPKCTDGSDDMIEGRVESANALLEQIKKWESQDGGGGDNPEEWEYPEDIMTSVSHNDKYFDLNFWTKDILDDHLELIEQKKMLTIYPVKPDKDSSEDMTVDYNTFMSFELKSTEGDVKKSIVEALGIDDE